jgi:hypothetical protein
VRLRCRDTYELILNRVLDFRLSSYAYHSPYTYSLALDPPTLDLVEAVRLVAPHAYRCTNIHTHSGDARVLPLILQHIASVNFGQLESLTIDPIQAVVESGSSCG